jgi:hypothetical protein
MNKELPYLLVDECIASVSTDAVVWHTCYYELWTSELKQIPISYITQQ